MSADVNTIAIVMNKAIKEYGIAYRQTKAYMLIAINAFRLVGCICFCLCLYFFICGISFIASHVNMKTQNRMSTYGQNMTQVSPTSATPGLDPLGRAKSREFLRMYVSAS